MMLKNEQHVDLVERVLEKFIKSTTILGSQTVLPPFIFTIVTHDSLCLFNMELQPGQDIPGLLESKGGKKLNQGRRPQGTTFMDSRVCVLESSGKRFC
jgi:hypothetical protein